MQFQTRWQRCETCGNRSKYCDCFFECKNFKDNLIDYKCLCCNKNYQHKFDEKSKERFFNKYKFAKQNYIKFNLLFLKGFHPWEKSYETSLPEKKIFTIT